MTITTPVTKVAGNFIHSQALKAQEVSSNNCPSNSMIQKTAKMEMAEQTLDAEHMVPLC